jgi:hypothetical protein
MLKRKKVVEVPPQRRTLGEPRRRKSPFLETEGSDTIIGLASVRGKKDQRKVCAFLERARRLVFFSS